MGEVEGGVGDRCRNSHHAVTVTDLAVPQAVTLAAKDNGHAVTLRQSRGLFQNGPEVVGHLPGSAEAMGGADHQMGGPYSRGEIRIDFTGLEDLLAVGGDHNFADTRTINHSLPDMLDEVLARLAGEDLAGEPPGTQAGWYNDRGCPVGSRHVTTSWETGLKNGGARECRTLEKSKLSAPGPIVK